MQSWSNRLRKQKIKEDKRWSCLILKEECSIDFELDALKVRTWGTNLWLWMRSLTKISSSSSWLLGIKNTDKSTFVEECMNRVCSGENLVSGSLKWQRGNLKDILRTKDKSLMLLTERKTFFTFLNKLLTKATSFEWSWTTWTTFENKDCYQLAGEV